MGQGRRRGRWARGGGLVVDECAVANKAGNHRILLAVPGGARSHVPCTSRQVRKPPAGSQPSPWMGQFAGKVAAAPIGLACWDGSLARSGPIRTKRDIGPMEVKKYKGAFRLGRRGAAWPNIGVAATSGPGL